MADGGMGIADFRNPSLVYVQEISHIAFPSQVQEWLIRDDIPSPIYRERDLTILKSFSP